MQYQLAISNLVQFKNTSQIKGIQEFTGHLLSVVVGISRLLDATINKLRAFNNHTDKINMQIEAITEANFHIFR